MKTDKFEIFNTPDGKIVIEAVKKAKNIVLVTHVGPDVDGLACEVAAHGCLTSMGKSVSILNSANYSDGYGYIDPDGLIRTYTDSRASVIKNADLMLALDVSEPKRIGRVLDVAKLNDVKILAIDHHPRTENSLDGLLDPRFSSASEIIFGFNRLMGCKLDARTAFTIYCGIIYDTQMFRFLKNDSQTFEVAAALVDAGADADMAQQLMYGSRAPDRLRLLARVVDRMHVEKKGRLAWSFVDEEALKGLHVDSADIREMVSEILFQDRVMVSAFFKPGDDNTTKVSLRSKPPFRIDGVARQFNGGGHPQASGCRVDKPFAQGIEDVVAALRSMPEFNS